MDTPAGTVIQCPVSCSTMIHAVRAQGPAVKVSEPIAIATYTHHGTHFRGYITYQQPDAAYIQSTAFSGSPRDLHMEETRLFTLTKDRHHAGYAPHATAHAGLPDVFSVVADETGPLHGRKYPFDGTVKYGSPYKLFTSWNFLPCPNTLISRRQELDKLLPTTASVMCMYNGRARGRDGQGKIECAYDNSRWVFVPADGATEEGETLCKDDLFYIAEYPGVGKSRFLKWNEDVSNFDLVQKSEASVFSFPSSPVDQGPNHSTCQYVPGKYVNDPERIVPLQDDGQINIQYRENDQGDQMIYQSGPGPLPLPLVPQRVPRQWDTPSSSADGLLYGDQGKKKMGHYLWAVLAALIGLFVVIMLRHRKGCEIKIPGMSAPGASSATASIAAPGNTVRIIA